MELCEQDRGQLPSSFDGERVLESQGAEDLHEQQPRGVFVPVALGSDDGEESLDGEFALACGDEASCEVIGGLEVGGVGAEAALELVHLRQEFLGVPAQFEHGGDGDDFGVFAEILVEALEHGFDGFGVAQGHGGFERADGGPGFAGVLCEDSLVEGEGFLWVS